MNNEVDQRAYSHNEDVRDDLAWNTTSVATMRVLARDESERVRTDLMVNDAVPSEIIDFFLANASDELNIGAIINGALNPNVTVEQLRQMMEIATRDDLKFGDPDSLDNLRMNIASSPTAPRDILEVLSRDAHAEVSNFAKESLAALDGQQK